ncbi:MAG: zf-HC2 domain-containing protein [Acidobacteriota bacterium]|nr:zf-HC2 domain-containing protein [Acidobacteriota bacterium]
MLNTDSSSICGRAEALRDYAFDELPASERDSMDRHLAQCAECALEFDRLQLTAAALRILPDREIPQRIAFVSDKVFEPSWMMRFLNSGARMGFASACVLAVAIIVSAWHFAGLPRPVEVRTVVQTAAAGTDRQQVDEAVAIAVAQVRKEDAQMIRAAVRESAETQDRQYRNQIVAMQESFDMLRKRMNYSFASLASSEGGAR